MVNDILISKIHKDYEDYDSGITEAKYSIPDLIVLIKQDKNYPKIESSISEIMREYYSYQSSDSDSLMYILDEVEKIYPSLWDNYKPNYKLPV